jgi:hypothetical protein
VATAEACSEPVPSVVAPSLKVTVPVGVPGVAEVVVAVRVTDCPKILGFGFEASAVDDGLGAAELTSCWTVGETLAA